MFLRKFWPKKLYLLIASQVKLGEEKKNKIVSRLCEYYSKNLIYRDTHRQGDINSVRRSKVQKKENNKF